MTPFSIKICNNKCQLLKYVVHAKIIIPTPAKQLQSVMPHKICVNGTRGATSTRPKNVPRIDCRIKENKIDVWVWRIDCRFICEKYGALMCIGKTGLHEPWLSMGSRKKERFVDDRNAVGSRKKERFVDDRNAGSLKYGNHLSFISSVVQTKVDRGKLVSSVVQTKID